MNSLTGLIAITTLIFFVFRKARRYLALRQFNGPPLSGFTRLWGVKANSSGRLHEYYAGFNDKYGKICRIGPDMLLTKDPAIVKRINAVRSDYTRSKFYLPLRLHPSRDNIITATGEAHAKIRQAMAPGYSGKENMYLEADVEACLLKMIRLIETKYLSTKSKFVPFDLARTCSFFTLDVLSTVAFGKCFGFLESDTDPFDYIEQGKKTWPFLMIMVIYPELHRLLRLPVISALLPSASDASGLGRVMQFAKEVVAERFGENKIVRKDMLGSFLAHGIPQEQLESETLIQITAGSDSSATALRVSLLHITTNPRVYGALMRELDGAITSGRVSRPFIRDQEARRLPYLQACIKEGLRMFPPVTSLLAKAVPPQGDTFDGKFVPGGTQVGWNVWGLMRDHEFWGEDADTFRPERWLLEEDEAKLAKMTEVQGMVFGAGKYGCLGRGVAMVELDKAIAELLLRFDFEVVNPSKPYDCISMGFFLHENMFFRVTERQKPGEADEVMERAERIAGKKDFGMETLWEDMKEI